MGNHPLVKYSPFDQKGWNLKKWSPGKNIIHGLFGLDEWCFFVQWEGIHPHGLGLEMMIFSTFSRET